MKKISREYAEALFMIASERQLQKQFFQQLESVKEILDSEQEYAELLSSPSVPLSERLNLIESAFDGKLDGEVLSFIMLLTEKGRICCFSDCVKEYKELISEMENKVNAVVKSAVKLTPMQMEKLQKQLSEKSRKNVVLEQEIDTAIVGGVVIEIDGKIIDASLRRKLDEIVGVIGK